MGVPKRVLSLTESQRLLQTVLFDVDNFEKVDADTWDLVVGEILEVMNPHVESDLPQALFDKWFMGEKNSFVKQVAQRIKGFEGRVRDVVTQVLLQLFFESYQYIGQSIWAVMRDFEHGVDPPLNQQEKAVFRLLYYPQDMLGGLPLILLRDKLEFTEGILLRLLNDPRDERAIGALHQLLTIYADTVRWRRQIDRDRKRGRPLSLVSDVASTPTTTPRQGSSPAIERLVELLDRDGKLHCACAAPEWQLVDGRVTNQTFVVLFECHKCGTRPRGFRLTKAQLKELRNVP